MRGLHRLPDPVVLRDPAAAMLDALRDAAPVIRAEAAGLDEDGSFPQGGLAALRQAGLLAAPLPVGMGGAGLGTSPDGALPLTNALRLIGRASLPLGRVFEGHVNALRLVLRHGSPAQAEAAARDARQGRLFGVWNTDGFGEAPLALADGVLRGRKILCSGAGWVERALVTAREAAEAPPQMLLVALAPGERADLAPWTAQGMRASATGAVDFTGLPASAIGVPGDYLRQPDFSGGAWRFAAVQCGGLEAVLGLLRAHLRRTGRGGDPHQAARLGQAAIAAETARLWVVAAAERAEAAEPASDVVAQVNLARLAVERAALDVLELAQRSIGLQAFMRPNPIERVARDLATYLRQPAPDRALVEAAAHVLAAEAEPGDLWDR
ncbi:acyl-CoA dehydrogenase family protein [Falsiroseomonas tokyonensis]|uniref:Acyl-CoA dehydrogenase family protein n=1 Tax=Falsiroseomonas tokyonensis TaxID=430521 RepID=A0ABV7BUJ6_9PROT|nr:acyl-CoA dehydrogenase family protein [Falsiroseomonas tokyonensis]MBU8537831.1 acyl-CoA dehydrogenase family protein [Falsiroseomonas tokyonensis]